ncbi:MAG: hypothetical protein CVT88_01445 [Candidatus Altiarchaeales archaeon HGW-Altiarchaeales-1]|nr:MAG: hypothetical protein CVT88_01445 [Candidatus Altiarchaeales archaeon HGW-Altiarchaeales-1]
MKIDAIWIISLALLMMPIIILMIDIPRTIMIILLIILTPILIINTLMLLSGRVRISVINILIWFWVVLRHPDNNPCKYKNNFANDKNYNDQD